MLDVPYLDDGDVRLYHGDAATVLRTLPAASVQTCVTSPPYWGLRDYGTAEWSGGDPDCAHAPEDRGGRFASPVSAKQASNNGSGTMSRRDCPCGARRVDDQLGLETTPSEYVTRLVAVFREVRRVLRDDGTLWLNLGDSYASSPRGNAPDDWSSSGLNGAQTSARCRESWAQGPAQAMDKTRVPGLKPKDLVGIPWRVAFALQADGWYLRSDIIWSKPNPMPESVTDRPTKAHEYVFLLTKQPRYYYDQEAIREPAEYGRREWSDTAGNMAGVGIDGARGHATVRGSDPATGRNARSVWAIATQPTPEAHFATFPEALARRCILAGSRPGDTILDPFVGSGTTALVARKHGRHAVGLDLSAEYLAIAAKRISQLSLLT